MEAALSAPCQDELDLASDLELDEITRRVQQQYERFPYPGPKTTDINRDPLANSDHLRAIQLAAWPRKRDLSDMKVLDAGCGTGYTVMWIAARHPDVEVLGIDISETSLRCAQDYANEWSIGNVRFKQHQIYDLPDLGEQFDLIVCTGVLHHLSDPDRGLQCLRDVLKPQGVAWIMVYGRYGRTGIYVMQDLLRMVGQNLSQEEQAPVARRIIESLPSGHHFQRDHWRGDLRMEDNIGLVDLLLHPQDRAYTVPQVYAWAQQAGLKVLGWMPKLAYDPERLVRDPDLKAAFAHLSPEERATVAELVRGNTRRHFFLAARPEFEHETVTLEGANWDRVVPVCDPFSAVVMRTEGDDRHRQEVARLMYSYGDMAMGRRLEPWQAALVRTFGEGQNLRAICGHKLMRQHLSSYSNDRREKAIREFVAGAVGDGFVHLTL